MSRPGTTGSSMFMLCFQEVRFGSILDVKREERTYIVTDIDASHGTVTDAGNERDYIPILNVPCVDD